MAAPAQLPNLYAVPAPPQLNYRLRCALADCAHFSRLGRVYRCKPRSMWALAEIGLVEPGEDAEGPGGWLLTEAGWHWLQRHFPKMKTTALAPEAQ